jgi:hypothetical protein
MDDKFECRGKWFLLIIRTPLQIVKFLEPEYLSTTHSKDQHYYDDQ